MIHELFKNDLIIDRFLFNSTSYRSSSQSSRCYCYNSRAAGRGRLRSHGIGTNIISPAWRPLWQLAGWVGWCFLYRDSQISTQGGGFWIRGGESIMTWEIRCKMYSNFEIHIPIPKYIYIYVYLNLYIYICIPKYIYNLLPPIQSRTPSPHPPETLL